MKTPLKLGLVALQLLLLWNCNTASGDDGPESQTGGEAGAPSGTGGKAETDGSGGRDTGTEGLLDPGYERGPLPASQNPRLPFDAPELLYYNHCSRPVWFEGSKDVPTGTAAVLRDASGSAEYFQATEDQLLLSGFYLPISTVDGLPSGGADVLLDEDIVVWSRNWNADERIEFSGNGTIIDVERERTYDLSLTGVSRFWGEETISVPAGEFNTLHVSYSLEATTTLGEEEIVVPLTVELWLADGVGIVRRIQNKVPFELSRYGSEGSDASEHSVTNCAYRSVTEQHAYRAPAEPFVIYQQYARFGARYPDRLFAAPLNGSREPQHLTASLGDVEEEADGNSIVDFQLAPDRKHVAFVVESFGAYRLHIVRLADGWSWAVENESGWEFGAMDSVLWAPDSKAIAYKVSSADDVAGELWVENLQLESRNGESLEGESVLLASDVRGEPKWSPDGTSMAFLEDDAETIDDPLNDQLDAILFTAARSDGARTRLSLPGQFLRYTYPFAWAPNGASMLYLADPKDEEGVPPGEPQLFLLELDGGAIQQVSTLGNDLQDPGWSPDGRWIAFNERGLAVFEVETGLTRQVSQDPSVGSATDYSWSYDSTRLAYILRAHNSSIYDIFTVAPDGSELTRLDSNVRPSNRFTTWSPGELSLAYLVDQDLIVSHADGTERHNLSQEYERPISYGCDLNGDNRLWSPDGSRLAFCSEAEHSYFTVKTDGTGWVELDTMIGERQMPLERFAWSHDGSRIVFLADPVTQSGYELFSASATEVEPSVKISGTAHRDALVSYELGPQ